jgi:alpha-galactosidase/6-phospho-beta-glucosidase family protein
VKLFLTRIFPNFAGPASNFGRTLFVFHFGFQEAKFDEWKMEFNSIVTDAFGMNHFFWAHKYFRDQTQRKKIHGFLSSMTMTMSPTHRLRSSFSNFLLSVSDDMYFIIQWRQN